MVIDEYLNYFFNPTYLTWGGGQIIPPNLKSLCRVQRDWDSLTKVHDFVLLNSREVPKKPFFEFFLKILENWTSKIFRGPRALGEKWKNRKKISLFVGNITFFGWIFIVHAVSFLLRYIKVLYLKIWNFALFWHEKSHFWSSSFDSS